MDATLSLGLPRMNRSGTLLEGIALWGELKPQLTHEAVIARALTYCDMAVAQGLLAIRSHVDVCDDRLIAVEALLEVKKRVASYLELQLVAFPQDGIYRSSTAERNLLRALELGVEVVGGIPHFERTMADGAAWVRHLCEIAAERGLLVESTAMNLTILSHAISKLWRRRQKGSTSAAGWQVPISLRCTRWTIITFPNSYL